MKRLALAGLLALSPLAATADTATGATGATAETATAVFAGGCFWCVEKDFDKLEGVLETTSGFAGGTVANPSYQEVVRGGTGHYEVVQVTYDPQVVTYPELVTFHFRHIDPTDAGGQFCDRGHSYKTAIFAGDAEEAGIARQIIAELEAAEVLPGPIVTPVLDAAPFYAAEEYHQDYYVKNPLRYTFYRTRCGRDARVEAIWAEAPGS